MASVADQLLAALDDLETEKLKRFKWHLKNHKGVSAADLENADAPDTVDLMMKRFRPEEAVKTTVDILRKMNHNHLAEELENKHKQDQADGSIEDPAIAGAGLKSEVTSTNIVPRTRKDFLQYSHRLTLDLNTVNKRLRLSEGNRVITVSKSDQSYPDHPDRFAHVQVLCRESVCGRCYWEIEWSGYGVSISVSYKRISRKGPAPVCGFGFNDQSWSLFCSPGKYIFWHNGIQTVLPLESSCRRVGVYVDHGAGILSFYLVYSDTMSLIHTVHTTFTQPLYPGLGSNYVGSSLKLC
ncbi:tripartite motif-containing protein 16-like [Garra rufa]|uniref:tripartite motif-containing protein 16-like n=1 Tax=Garra rufa TaxID=137080 RepID=UPI003CCEA14D